MEIQFKVVPSRYYDTRDIGGGCGWSWAELVAKPEHGMKVRIPLGDTHPHTVALAKEMAEDFLASRESET